LLPFLSSEDVFAILRGYEEIQQLLHIYSKIFGTDDFSDRLCATPAIDAENYAKTVPQI
jgi:hypothetical protein